MGFSYSLTQGSAEGPARGWDAGWTERIIKVTVGIIIPAMERASTALFFLPPRHKCSVHGFVTDGASTFYLYKEERGRAGLVSTWQFSIIKTNDRHRLWGSRGAQKKRGAFRCWLSADLLPVFVGDLTLNKKLKRGFRLKAQWQLNVKQSSPPWANDLIGEFACFPFAGKLIK